MGKNNIVTEYNANCIICGAPTEEQHHLVFGRGLRELAEADKIYSPMCRFCHEELHTKSSVAAALSRMVGQLAWEKHLIATEGVSEDEARKRFRSRYHQSYL